MGKLRVQDVAKELGVPVKKIRVVLKEWGIEKGNFAYLDEEELQIVYDNLLPSKEKLYCPYGHRTTHQEHPQKHRL